MTKDVRVYLNDILECIDKISEYTKGMSMADFLANVEKQDSVLRRLEIIGEAVKNVPQNVKDKYPDIPWKQIAGMRDILIHEYAGVRLERVWRVIEGDLQSLKQKIKNITIM